MRRLSACLVFLLFLLTFNAYACVLPLQTPAVTDCSSETEEPMRQMCDAFLEMGPHSEVSSNTGLPAIHVDFGVATRLTDVVASVFRPIPLPLGADRPIHLSISTTVLRI